MNLAKRQAILLSIFTLTVLAVNILVGSGLDVWLFFFDFLLFFACIFIEKNTSGILQASIIFLNGSLVLTTGDQTVGMLFMVLGVYCFCIFASYLHNKKLRYIIILIIIIISTIIRVSLCKDIWYHVSMYSVLFFTVILFIDSIILQTIENEKNKVREEMKELSELIKRFDITTKELEAILKQKGPHHGV